MDRDDRLMVLKGDTGLGDGDAGRSFDGVPGRDNGFPSMEVLFSDALTSARFGGATSTIICVRLFLLSLSANESFSFPRINTLVLGLRLGTTLRVAARLGKGGGADGDAGVAPGVLVGDGSCVGSLFGVVGAEGGRLVDEGVPGRLRGLDERGGLAGVAGAVGVVAFSSFTGSSGFFSGRGVGSSFNTRALSPVAG